MNHPHKFYTNIESLPQGVASSTITEGCIALEGGAFRGLYTSGVLDALMLSGIHMRTTIGVSAGALNGLSYVSGQIGRAGRINLKYCNDSRYVGRHAYVANHGIIGFDFLFHDVNHEYPMDYIRFYAKNRSFVAVATNCKTGQSEYFEKSTCTDIFQAVRASASMPYVSQMVDIDGSPYLDGGCSTFIPYKWPLEQGFEKIIVVRTRPDDFRNSIEEKNHTFTKRLYSNYPEFEKNLENMDERYNQECNEIEALRNQGRIFVLSPSQPIDIGRLERDTEKLGDLYYMGYNDTMDCMEELQAYLKGTMKNDSL